MGWEPLYDLALEPLTDHYIAHGRPPITLTEREARWIQTSRHAG